MNKKSLTKLFICVGIFGSWNLHAQIKIEQTLEIKSKDSSHKLDLVWYIKEDKFNLQVSDQKLLDVMFVFTGQSLFICRKAANLQLPQISDLKINVDEVKNKLKTGICQVAPSNFLVSFLVSPEIALLGMNLKEGFNLTYNLTELASTVSEHPKTGDFPCEGQKQKFVLSPKGTSNSQVTLTHQSQTCIDKQVEWQKKLGKEVMKTMLMRTDTRSQAIMVKNFLKNGSGVRVESEGNYERIKGDGTKMNGSFVVKTSKFIRKAKVPEELWALPQSYEVLDEQALIAWVSQTLKGEKKEKAVVKEEKSKQNESESNLLLILILGSIL